MNKIKFLKKNWKTISLKISDAKNEAEDSKKWILPFRVKKLKPESKPLNRTSDL